MSKYGLQLWLISMVCGTCLGKAPAAKSAHPAKPRQMVASSTITVPLASTPNLVHNADFESGTGPGGLPAEWDTWVPFAGPILKVADDQKHAGTHSAYIETKDSTGFLLSNVIPVAPGEKLTLGAWCRVADISSTTTGTYGIAAGWMDANKQYLDKAEYKTLPLQNSDWFTTSVDATVPPKAAYMTFQLRHKALSAKTWWDDVELHAATPVALRLGIMAPAAEPGNTTISAVLINRSPQLAGQSVKIRTSPGNHEEPFKLTSEPETTVTLHFNIEKRGAQTLTAEILSAGGEKLFASENKVTVPPPLVMEPILPVYSCVEDGPQTIESRIWVHEPDEVRANATLHCTVRKAGTGEQTTAIAELNVSPPILENRLTFKLPPQDKGDYLVECALVPAFDRDGDHGIDDVLAKKGSSITSASQDWHIISRSQATVTFSDDGYPIMDGKKTFPMGLYDGSDYPDLASAGFNITQNFDVGHVRRGNLPDNQRMKKILDQSMSLGMKHLFLVVHGPNCRVLDDEYLRRLKMFKNHPGVFCWYEEEGVARGDVKLDFLRQFHDTVKQLAPEHPIILGDTIDSITKVTDRSNFFPVDYMDGAIWWWYPFPIKKGGRPGAYEGEEIGNALELVPPSFLTLAKTKKPIWVALQAYKKPKGRFPTEAEYRAQPYIAVIYGAKGLYWYTGLDVQTMREEGHFEYLKKLVHELREMSPVFMAPDSTETVKLATPNEMICYRLKDAGDKLVLLAVNRNDRPADVTFEIPGVKSDAAAVRYENRAVPAAGKLTDHFDPYAVHIYELKK